MASRLTTYIVVLIVTGTVIAGLIVGAQREDLGGRVDLIITNGRVFTGAGEDVAEAIAVQGNKILRVGSNREIKRLRRAQTLMLDAHGASVLPGFIDTHVHLSEASRQRAGVDLTDADSPEAVQARIGSYAKAHPDSTWIRGHDWPSALSFDVLSTPGVLDDLVPERPVFLVTGDGRTAWANDRALELAGITRHTPSPRGGEIVKDPRTGELTGVLMDSAQELVVRALPAPTDAERLEGLQTAIREAHSAGVTSVHSIGDTADDLDLYDTLHATGDLRLRVYSAVAVTPTGGQAQTDRLKALRARYPDDPVLKAGAALVTLDGASGSSEGSDAAAVASNLSHLIAFLDARGWQTLIEAPTEAGVAAALDAVEMAQQTNPAPDRGRRHRIEQVNGLDAELAARMARLGVTASIRPTGEESDADAFRLVADAGARVTFGSDWPSSILDPRRGLAAAQPGEVAGEEEVEQASAAPPTQEGLTLERAVDAYTSAAAWTSFDDQRKGMLARGMLADIVILTSDIFVPGTPLMDVEVDTTIFDGKIVHKRSPTSGTQ
jgi:hypothetical protein